MTVQTFALTLAAISLCAAVSAKTGSTIYTPERVANARRNIARYDWAKQQRDNTVNTADAYVRQTDDWLWNLVTPQSIPRGTQVSIPRGCPKCGKAIERFGRWPWKVDVFKRPWKIECPSCGAVFPTNDFGKFYESGKDEHGIFRPERADRSLLYNTDHPDPADPLHTYGVDDGLGWKNEKGDVYRFVGYCGHYGAWTHVLSALTHLRDAYVYTGEPIYARKAGIVLYRAAQFYPDMDWAYWNKLGFNNSDGGSGKGKVYGRIWETGVARTLMLAYDGVYSGLDDPELLKYLSAKEGKPIDAAGVRAMVENNIIRVVHDGVLAGRISGNEGMHQSTMATAAVVLDEPGTSEKWLSWLFADGDVNHGNPNGGNIKRLFAEKVDDDGMGGEASPMYNSIWRQLFKVISEVLELYPKYDGPKITDFPKYKKMFEAPVRLICCDRYVPNIGDCGKTGFPALTGANLDGLVYAYETFKDPIFAQMADYVARLKSTETRGDILDPNPEDQLNAIRAVVKEKGPYIPKTDHLPAYGLAILRSGTGENQRALTLYYGRNMGHGHKDTLNIDLFGYGLDLMPDIGYPEHASVWPARYEWTSNTISHNTVTVDHRKQAESFSGKARFVKQGDGVSAAEVYAGKVYPQTTLYQRTTAMVDASDADFYVVDIFRVKGGKECHYSLHGPEGDVETEGLNMVDQGKGTLAGENVDYAAKVGDGRDYWKTASGFQYLYDVRRDKHPAGYPAVIWKCVDTWHVTPYQGGAKGGCDIRLRVNMVNPPGEVILAHGDPPQNKQGNPRRLTYLLETHTGGQSTFVNVIEPYSGERAIKSIERTDKGDTVTLKITLVSGRVDYIVSSTSPQAVRAGGLSIKARFAVISRANGKATLRLAAS